MSEQAHEGVEQQQGVGGNGETGQTQPPQQQQQPGSLSRENIHVELTNAPLSITEVMNKIRSPKAGALVLFAGIPPSFLPSNQSINQLKG